MLQDIPDEQTDSESLQDLLMRLQPRSRFYAMFLTVQFAASTRVNIALYREKGTYLLTTSQSIPSFIPFPSIAEQATMLQFLSLSSLIAMPRKYHQPLSPLAGLACSQKRGGPLLEVPPL